MMNFILLTIGIYVALVGASVTIIMLVMSKWYIDKTKKMTKEMLKDDFTDNV